MNTDNTSISGETIDYGPCAFLDEYDPEQEVQLDRSRRSLRVRATSRASRTGTWRGSPRRSCRSSPTTKTRPFASPRSALERFPRALRGRARARPARQARPRARGRRTTARSPPICSSGSRRTTSTTRVFFRRLCACRRRSRPRTPRSRRSSPTPALPRLGRGLAPRGSRSEDARPRGARAARCAASTRPSSRATTASRRPSQAAVRRDDFAPFETLVDVLERPYDDQPEFAHLAEPPRPEERVQRPSAARRRRRSGNSTGPNATGARRPKPD